MAIKMVTLSSRLYKKATTVTIKCSMIAFMIHFNLKRGSDVPWPPRWPL
jgi:hypothetical protein